MSYAGNPNLAADLQKRILDTFRHTLDVAARGGLEEARLGCDFVLQLDPQFTLAQVLSDKLRGASGPLLVDDIRARLDGVPKPAAAAPPPRAAAPGPAASPQRPAAAAPPPRAAASIADLRQELAELVAARNFSALTARAQREHVAIAADPALQQLLAIAQEMMEAAPYVDKFIDQARQASAAGRFDEARSLVDKARALDSSHPALAQIRTAPPAAPPPAASRPAAGAPATPGAGAAPPPLRTADPDATYELATGAPSPELSFGGLQADQPEMSMDLPPLELPDIDEAVPDELSLEGLTADEAPAAGGAASDGDPRIAELLDDGQAQFARGDLQGAIDAWSRIFLIDIDHEEAARRIDQARNAKAEQERQVEEAYHDALGLVQKRDWEGAKTTLRRVLELQPNHVAARDVLAKVERGELTDLPRPPTPSGETALLAELTGIGLEDDLKEEILVPPEPGDESARPLPGKVKQPPSRRTLLMAVAAVLVVLLGAGWFLMTRWSSLFPNSETPPTAATPAVEQTPITRATDLHKQGKGAVAIAQLKRVPPASPYYEEAQALIGQWQQEEAANQAAAPPAPEQLAKREALLDEARQAESERRFLAVQSLLTQAQAIAPLSEDELALQERAQKAVEPLKEILVLLRSEEYDRSLRDLWVVLEKDSDNADARNLLTTAYYNKGIISLQQGKPDEAQEYLDEAVALTPGDADVQRLLQVTQTYQERAPDLLYRIYTKYLTPRAL